VEECATVSAELVINCVITNSFGKRVSESESDSLVRQARLCNALSAKVSVQIFRVCSPNAYRLEAPGSGSQFLVILPCSETTWALPINVVIYSRQLKQS
jgi:hypothetical protein